MATNLIRPAKDTLVAPGTLLVGLLGVSVRNTKIPGKSPHSSYTPFPRVAGSAASKRQSADRVLQYPDRGLPGKVVVRSGSKNNFTGAAMTGSWFSSAGTLLDPRSLQLKLAPAYEALLSSPATEGTNMNGVSTIVLSDELCNLEGRDENAIGNAAELPAEQATQEFQRERAEEERPAPNLLAFYGLRQQPFDVTPDPAYLYLSPAHREALSAISLGVENLRGFMALIAEPGLGKTTLLNKLMEDLRDSARVVFLFQTQCNSSELLRYLLTELEVEFDGNDIVAMHRALSQALFEEMVQGRRFVLIVDEAQNLQESVLETIRLLSDYETTHSKLIQIVLAGQHQLVDTLMRPSLSQLRQRIAVLANLQPLSVTETGEYIEHRLRAAGWVGESLFTPDAVALIAESSAGVPRNINNLCFNAMLAGYLQRQGIIDSEVVKKVASKLDLEPLRRSTPQDTPVAQTSAQPNAQIGTQVDSSDVAQLARALSAALNGGNALPVNAGPGENPEAKTSVTVTGKLNEKVRSQSWSKKRESRINVSFERDPMSGVTVADRHYCCSFYIGEEQAVALQAGKPIRIKIEQD